MTNQNSKVYETMIRSNHPDTIKNLTGWKRPIKDAYVLLEVPQYNLIADGEGFWGMGLATVNAESQADVIDQVENLLKKGGRVLDYGNFPKLTDPNPKRAAKAALYSQGTGQEPWQPLEDHLKRVMRGDEAWGEKEAAMKAEIDALRAKVAEKDKAAATKATKEEK